jgi:hypothetical protein
MVNSVASTILPEPLLTNPQSHAIDTSSAPKEETMRKMFQKLMVSAEVASLSSKTFQSALNIITFFSKLPSLIGTVITIAKVPCIFFDVISCSASAYDTYKTKHSYRILTTALRICTTHSSQNDKIVALQTVVSELAKIDNADAILKTFNLSPNGKKALKEKIQLLQNHLIKDYVADEDIACVRTLVGRARTHLRLKSVETAANCASVAAGIIVIVPVPVAAQITSALIYTVCAISMTALWSITQLFTNHNPFDPSSRSPVGTVINSGIHHIQIATGRVQKWLEPRTSARAKA